MIINVLDELIDKRFQLDNFYDFLKNIMLAYKESKHIICISPKKVRELIKDEFVKGNNDLLQILYSFNNYSKSFNLTNLKEKFNVIINVTYPKDEYLYYSELLNKVEIREISYLEFIDSSSIQKTILLGENLSDIDIYNIFVDYYKAKNNLETFINMYEKRGGGGNTVKNEYANIYERKENFCLSILDSDKKFPKQSKFGDTAQFVVDYHNNQVLSNNHNLKQNYHVLNVLELENLLPKNFYINKYTDKSHIFEKIDQLLNIENNFRKYFDFKKGIKCKLRYDETEKKIKDCNEGSLKEYLCPLLFNGGINMTDKIFLNGFEGKNTNILKDFASWDKKEVFKFVREDSFVEENWNEIGKYISSYILVHQSNRAI